MKRIGVLTIGLAVAVLVAGRQTGEADEKKEERVIPKPEKVMAPPPAVAVVKSCANVQDDQVQELIKIINETKSPYTLVATAVALMPLGEKAKVAVPAILRNAERLKVLEDLGKPNSKKYEVAELLLESIYTIQAGWTPDNDPFYGPPTPRWAQERLPAPRPAMMPPPPPGYGVPPMPFYAPAAPPCPGSVCPLTDSPKPTGGQSYQ
jgi:hypothetical protein